MHFFCHRQNRQKRTNLPLQQRIMADGGFCAGGQNIHYLEKRIAEAKEKAIKLS